MDPMQARITAEEDGENTGFFKPRKSFNGNEWLTIIENAIQIFKKSHLFHGDKSVVRDKSQ